MTALWHGSITLPEGLPELALEDVELQSSIPDIGNSYNPQPEDDGMLFTGAALKLRAVVDSAKVPLHVSVGPSFEVRTQSQATANFLMNIFVQHINQEQPSDAEEERDDGGKDEHNTKSDIVQCKSTGKVIVVSVIYENPLEEVEKPIITELVLYGTLSSDIPPQPVRMSLAARTSLGARTAKPELQMLPAKSSAPPSLSVYALPTSTRIIREIKLQTAIKSEPLEPGRARFITPIIGRKRKRPTALNTYDSKRSYFARLPPGLHRDWHKHGIEHLPDPMDEFGENNFNTSNVGSQNNKLFSRSIGPSIMSQPVVDFRKTMNVDPRFGRERSASVLQTRLRAAAERPDPSRRESVTRPLRMSGDFTTLRRSETFAGLPTRTATPDIKQDFGASISNKPVASTTTVPATNKFAERNKTSAQKLILASMRLYGFTRAKAGEVKIEDKEEEYKLVFHTTLRSLTCAMRNSWNSEIIGVARLKETTEYLMKAFVGGSGVVQGSSDREEDHQGEENPFRKSRIGNRSIVLSGTASRDDTLVGDQSLLGNSLLGNSSLGESQLFDD
ncbi:hypothetical protein TWF730_008510 [Orbilia blumenaviensis]|uniref:Sld7 C-terminal domain-containing protein n=1 Tax=Orbilia blumenaviensis TaxID=1796055 RepID=A0AAV9V2V6_9PEZI